MAVELYLLDLPYAGYVMPMLYGKFFSCYLRHHHQAILALRKSASLHSLAASL